MFIHVYSPLFEFGLLEYVEMGWRFCVEYEEVAYKSGTALRSPELWDFHGCFAVITSVLSLGRMEVQHVLEVVADTEVGERLNYFRCWFQKRRP
jgi:hypothetical protein